MALERFKTQVLLLHSQQSTLDALGAGFNVSDKYAVHFATSGSEALNTLGETPIHVLVSAQDLPGMSGLEALREARKRSPDTIGILLAGSDRDDGLEALVGEKEVFQIVRGTVTSDALMNIIETATKRMRILALSESANDTAANVDEAAPDETGEHIVMETGENGASIISDGTGRLPVLRPERIQVSSQPGGREVDVLVLTKDEEFLKTIMESSRGLHNVHHAHTAQQAQDIVRQHKVGVLVTDAAIAGSKVQVLTQALRRDVPRLVAVVAGRRDDGEVLMGLINQGQVYRFLMKPVSPGRARLAVEASVKHFLDAPQAAAGEAAASAPARTAAAKPAADPPPPAKPPRKAAPPPAARQAPPQAPAKPPAKQRAEPAAPPRQRKAAADAVGTSGQRRTPVIKPIAQEAPDRREPAPLGMGFGNDSLGDEASRKLPLIGAAAAALVLLGGAAWFFGGESADDAAPVAGVEDTQPANEDVARTPAITESDVPARTAAPAQPGTAPSAASADAGSDASVGPALPPTAAATQAPDPAFVALLEDARFARDSGRLVAPAGNNAVEYYVAARDMASADADLGAELQALGEQVFALAESALLEKRADDAAAALEKIALIDADNPRLAFLHAQLADMQLRATLDDARLAIREARFEDAAARLTEAQAFATADPEEIDRLSADLAAARSAQEIDDVLALAGERLAAEQLTAPANDNARYYYELALSNDPGNLAARQGLDVIAGKLVLRARDAIDNDALDDAAALLDEARALDADNSDLEAAGAALSGAEERIAAAERDAAAARRAAAREAEAERRALEQRRAAATATLSTDAADAVPASAAPTFAPATTGGNETAPATADTERAPQEERAAESGSMVAISELVRVNYVAPEYPRNAQRRNISGWVDVGFTVTEAGTVSEIEVLDSAPGKIFDDAATAAVEQWRFRPVVVDGITVRRRSAVRMSFNLE